MVDVKVSDVVLGVDCHLEHVIYVVSLDLEVVCESLRMGS